MIGHLVSITPSEDHHILWYIYNNYRQDMFFAAMTIVKDPHLAEDIVQEAFERIIKKMHLIERISKNGLRRYNVLITRSIAFNMISKEKKYNWQPLDDVELLPANDDFSMDDTIIQREQIAIIRKCLEDMGVKYAHPLILRYYYGFSDSETAELLGISTPNTVRSLCYRGKKMILKAMVKAGDTYE